MKKLLLVMFFTMFPVLAHGATYYVAKTGSDNNSCANAQSQSTPKQTINSGIGCLFAGDTLIVKPGTYAEVVLWYNHHNKRSGTAGNPITIRSETPRAAIIQPGPAGMGQGLGGGRNIIAFENQSYWTVDGFITDGTGMNEVLHVIASGACNNITVLNTEMRYGGDNVTGNNTTGITTDFGQSGWTVRGNYIHHMGTGGHPGQSFYSYGIYFTASNSLIENNEIAYCSGHGMHMHNTQGTADNNIMRGNTFHHNGILPRFPGVLWAAGGHNSSMYNNIIYSNGGNGVRLGGAGAPGSNNLVANNTIWGNAQECVIVGAGGGYASSNNTIQNNICYQNGTDDVVVQAGSGNTIDHNLLGTDPLFANAAGADFHLRTNSPAINAGVVISGLPYNGSTPDLGALQSGAGVPPSVPPPTHLTGKVIVQ